MSFGCHVSSFSVVLLRKHLLGRDCARFYWFSATREIRPRPVHHNITVSKTRRKVVRVYLQSVSNCCAAGCGVRIARQGYLAVSISNKRTPLVEVVASSSRVGVMNVPVVPV